MCSKVHTQCGSMPIFSLHGQWWQKYTHSEKERDRDRTTKTGLARQTNSDDNDRKKKTKNKIGDKRFYVIRFSVLFFFTFFNTSQIRNTNANALRIDDTIYWIEHIASKLIKSFDRWDDIGLVFVLNHSFLLLNTYKQ